MFRIPYTNLHLFDTIILINVHRDSAILEKLSSGIAESFDACSSRYVRFSNSYSSEAAALKITIEAIVAKKAEQN